MDFSPEVNHKPETTVSQMLKSLADLSSEEMNKTDPDFEKLNFIQQELMTMCSQMKAQEDEIPIKKTLHRHKFTQVLNIQIPHREQSTNLIKHSDHREPEKMNRPYITDEENRKKYEMALNKFFNDYSNKSGNYNLSEAIDDLYTNYWKPNLKIIKYAPNETLARIEADQVLREATTKTSNVLPRKNLVMPKGGLPATGD